MRDEPSAPSLNAQQRVALSWLGKAPLRVIAGPGTGKTRTVVAMYLKLLQELGFHRSEILLLTFSTNAADELRTRINDEIFGSAESDAAQLSYDESWISTFHSFAYRILTDARLHPGAVPSTKKLMNSFQEKVLMRHVLEEAAAAGTIKSPALRHLATSEALAQDALWFIGSLKQELVPPGELAAWVTETAAGADAGKLADLAAIYSSYVDQQSRINVQDFKDVIAEAVFLFERDPEAASRISSKFRYVIVDEYQDVDAAQVRLLQLLTSAHADFPHIVAVGDPDQSIYSFRGTSPAFLENAGWAFDGQRVQLAENYRSVAPVLESARSLASEFRLSQLARDGLESVREEPAYPAIQIRREANIADEAASVARAITELLRPVDQGGAGYSPGDIAIILRGVRRNGRAFEEALQTARIPHQAGLSPLFAASDVVRFGISALEALAASDAGDTYVEGSDEQVAAMLQSPFCGLQPADANRLLREARRRREGQPKTLRTKSLVTVLSHAVILMFEDDPGRWPLPWQRRAGEESPNDDPLTAVDNPLPSLGDESASTLSRQEERINELAQLSSPETLARRGRDWYRLLDVSAKDSIYAFISRWLKLRSASKRSAPEILAYRVFQDLGVLTRMMAGSDDSLDSSVTVQSQLGPLSMFLKAIRELAEFRRPLLGRDPTLREILDHLPLALREYVDELEPHEGDVALSSPGQVRILTVHAAKGLEFPVVFMPAMASGRFPLLPRPRTTLLTKSESAWVAERVGERQPSRGEAVVGTQWVLEPIDFTLEEARLAYVGATRAADLLILSWADQYEEAEPAQPSAFLSPLAGSGQSADPTSHSSHTTWTARYTESAQAPTFIVANPADPKEAAAFLEWQPWAGQFQLATPVFDSPTGLTNYLACPRQYYYSRLLGLESLSGRDAARGTAFHNALSRFHGPSSEAKWRVHESQARPAYEECCRLAMESYLDLVDGAMEKKAEKARLQKLFDNYWRSESGNWGGRTVATEIKFIWTRDHGASVITGRLDRVVRREDGRYEIIDYKTGGDRTGNAVKKQLGLSPDDPPSDIQLVVYYFALSEAATIDPVSGRDASALAIGQTFTDVAAASLWFPKHTLLRPFRIRKVTLTNVMPPVGSGRGPGDVIDLEENSVQLRATMENALAGAHSGSYPATPRNQHYTCLTAWQSGCSHAWICPGRIEEPEGIDLE